MKRVLTTARMVTTEAKMVTEAMVEIVEGSAKMQYNQKEAVFYNKVQVFNRDTSIQVIRLFAETLNRERKDKYERKLQNYRNQLLNPNAETSQGKNMMAREPFPPPAGVSILDALAATGLRSVRYCKEITNGDGAPPLLRSMVINDLSPDATKAAMANCISNGVDLNTVQIETRDATSLMYEHREPNLNFDVIDLDPYGTACPFIDSAVQAISDGGLLIVTCTDSPVLSGNYPEVCFAKYGCMPVKAKYHSEMSLRILLNALETAANRYKRYVVPWLSLSVDFYVRVFVRVFESPSEVKNSSFKRCMLFQSTQCPSFYLQVCLKMYLYVPLYIYLVCTSIYHYVPLYTCTFSLLGSPRVNGRTIRRPSHERKVKRSRRKRKARMREIPWGLM